MRSFDYEKIREIYVKDYDYFIDDGCPPYEFYNPIRSDKVIYLVSRDNCFTAIPRNYVEYEVHFGGNRRTLFFSARRAIDWMFNKTPCLKLTGQVPGYNKKAIRFGGRLGFKHEGINRKSFMKNNILYDQYIMGLTREDWLCLHK